MSVSVAQAYLADILHAISQALLIPVIALLLIFIAYALFCIGSVIAEYFSERKHFKVVMPKFLAALMDAKEEDVPQVVEESGLLKRQKEALLTVHDYRALPGDALVALIKREVEQEESRYEKITGRNGMAARVSPMVGLMGTLIPLGPGIEALGRADTAALSSSLLVAFDTTVAGLIVAAVCLVVGKIRRNWYDDYLSALDSAMATMLEKIEDARDADPNAPRVSYAPAPRAASSKSDREDAKEKRSKRKARKQEDAAPAASAAPASSEASTVGADVAASSQTSSLSASNAEALFGADGAASLLGTASTVGSLGAADAASIPGVSETPATTDFSSMPAATGIEGLPEIGGMPTSADLGTLPGVDSLPEVGGLGDLPTSVSLPDPVVMPDFSSSVPDTFQSEAVANPVVPDVGIGAQYPDPAQSQAASFDINFEPPRRPWEPEE